MGMSDTIFEALADMDERIAEYPNHSDTDQRFHALYRRTTTAMRILQTYCDFFPGGNHDACLDRAMELIQSNDQRPWEEILEDLKRAFRSPIVLPPDDQGRQIVLDEPAISATQPPTRVPEDPRVIHFNEPPGSSSEDRPHLHSEETRQIFVPLVSHEAAVSPSKTKKVTAKSKAKAGTRSAKASKDSGRRKSR